MSAAVNVREIVQGLNGRRFGFEETVYLLLFGRMPGREELERFLKVLFAMQELSGRFVRIHRAYLAAWDKIEAVDWRENKVRVGGRTCLLSRAGRAELKKKLGGSL